MSRGADVREHRKEGARLRAAGGFGGSGGARREKRHHERAAERGRHRGERPGPGVLRDGGPGLGSVLGGCGAAVKMGSELGRVRGQGGPGQV